MENIGAEITEEEQWKNFYDRVKNGPKYHGETPECPSIFRMMIVLTDETLSFKPNEQAHIESCTHCQKAMESHKRYWAEITSDEWEEGFQAFLKENPIN